MNYTKDELITLLKAEVVPAVGCTEPVAVAFTTARATEILGCLPENIEIYLSRNILKNAMGVGIPGTDMVGLPIAIALGSVIGKSAYQLEVLKDVNPQAVREAKKIVDEKRISIQLKTDVEDKLYIECICKSENESSHIIVRGQHTHISLEERNGEKIFEYIDEKKSEGSETSENKRLKFRNIYDFSMSAPIEELRFILESEKVNMAASAEALKGSYGLNIGKTIRSKIEKGLLPDDACNNMISATSAAVDARMAGAAITVMSNSGSGNQGITATIPVSVYANLVKSSEEERIRALVLSHLTVICIKMQLGRLAALCGCVVASTGSSVAITYLMGGNYQQMTYALKNMVADITGMLCDGAKPSCSLKMSTGTSVAYYSALLAMENAVVSETEGIIDNDVDKTIENLAKIGSLGMQETDKMILDVMTSKK